MRLFIAIELPESVKDDMAGWMANLAGEIHDPRGRLHWVKKEQLHLTLKFLGETSEDRLSFLNRALATAAEEAQAFSLGLGKAGHFGGRVVWLGVESGAEEATRLAKSIDVACQSLKFDRESRPYRPHITLARAKESPGPLHFATLPTPLTQKTFGPFNVNSFAVVQSTLTPQGAIYKTLERFSLKD